MAEKFIERGTEHILKNGKLTLYETNCACKDIQFYFDQHVVTIMLDGHKTIESENLKFEFFPGTVFIPEINKINSVSIPNASFDNPTKCLVLTMEPSFVEAYYNELRSTEIGNAVLFKGEIKSSEDYYFSNDKLLISAFEKLYKIQFKDKSQSKILVEDLIMKEILLRIFQTEGAYLLKKNFEKSIQNKSIRKVITYISNNLDKKITTEQLASIAGMGQTTLFNKFKSMTGLSPILWVLKERIHFAKILIQKGNLNLQEISFRCGFNSYEYFCNSFKKIEKIKPSDYKKSIQRQEEIYV